MTASVSGWQDETTIAFWRLRSRHMATAPTAAEAPSYTDAFDVSMPVSAQISDWYSKITCRIPWLISAWYGVYAVTKPPSTSPAAQWTGCSGGKLPRRGTSFCTRCFARRSPPSSGALPTRFRRRQVKPFSPGGHSGTASRKARPGCPALKTGASHPGFRSYTAHNPHQLPSATNASYCSAVIISSVALTSDASTSHAS